MFHRSPLLLFDRKEKKLKAMVSTSDVTQVQGESIESNARVMENKWVHVGLVRGDKQISLYLNGQLDGMNYTMGWTVNNADPFFIGSTP